METESCGSVTKISESVSSAFSSSIGRIQGELIRQTRSMLLICRPQGCILVPRFIFLSPSFFPKVKDKIKCFFFMGDTARAKLLNSGCTMARFGDLKGQK